MDQECIIIGAGLAGASVAWHLAQAKPGMATLVLERESAAGTHATSQNAAMIRSLVLEDELVPFGLEGTRFWNRLPESIDCPAVFRRVGSLLLASKSATRALLERRVEEARAYGFEAEMWSPERCRESIPALGDTPMCAGAWSAFDGVADPQAVLDGFLRGASSGGAVLRRRSAVASIESAGNQVQGVRLEDGTLIEAAKVVIAAGAWAPELMEPGHASGAALRPHRRHLFHTGFAEGSIQGLSRQTPFVWHVDLQAYFRWESGGVLFSACDEEPFSACRPEVAPGIEDLAEQRLGKVFPFLIDLPLSNLWAGLRTFTPDHAFVIGREPSMNGLYYAAGLGGHGVTCAAPVGRVVAEAVIDS